MSDSLERLINHDFRLDLLCCLIDGPLPASALMARVGKPEAAVAYHLRLLEGREVLGRIGPEGDGDTQYAATLDKHPPWVAEAVGDHREARPRPPAAVRAMVGMKCDCCEHLLQYKSEVIAVYRVEGSGPLQAELITDNPPESGDAVKLRATEKYHLDCYYEARSRDPTLPRID